MPFYKTPGGGVLHAAFPDETLEAMDTTERIRIAVLAERERCAKVAESLHDGTDTICLLVAAEIRRGE